MQKEKSSPRKIYVFGNPMVKKDTLAVTVAKRLADDFPEITFIHLDPNEEINEKDVTLLDVAYGIKKVSVIDDLDKLDVGKKVSLHDYDVAFSLKLMKKIGMIKKVNIIAIPINYSLAKACREVSDYLHLTFKK